MFWTEPFGGNEALNYADKLCSVFRWFPTLKRVNYCKEKLNCGSGSAPPEAASSHKVFKRFVFHCESFSPVVVFFKSKQLKMFWGQEEAEGVSSLFSTLSGTSGPEKKSKLRLKRGFKVYKTSQRSFSVPDVKTQTQTNDVWFKQLNMNWKR